MAERTINNSKELSKETKKYNKNKLYPEYLKEPIDEKCIMFESYWGMHYSCNPRGLYEYINDNHPDYKCVWSLDDETTPVPGNAIKVKRQSKEYYYYLATAKYFVCNVNFEPRQKRKEQIEIHTTHGTPYKKVVMDVYDSDAPRKRQLKAVKNWDYLLVQGRFGEENGPRWYGFENEILKFGYPRTDCLFNVTQTERSTIKSSLGLPTDRQIILYAPTFREEGSFDMQLDLDAMKAALKDDYILLVRLHHLAGGVYKVPEDGEFIFDMGRCEDIQDLYNITDILITDYSSVMFDYALTGGSMIFYTYDLDEYTETTRGCYFDIKEEAPGPVVLTTEEVIHAVLNPGGEYNHRIEAFKQKYLSYERADSSAQIFNAVIKKEESRIEATRKKAKKNKSLIRRIKRYIKRKLRI